MTNTTLREAFNRFDVTGVLAEKNLEVKVFGDKEAIVGELVIKTGENSFTKLKVFTNRFTQSGAESKAYTAFTTVMNEYKSIAETGNEEIADKVSAFGKLSEGKPYVNQQGEVVAYVSNQVSFISRVTDMSKYNPGAKWQGEVFVQGIKNELKKVGDDMEETGRKIMAVVVPTYGGKAFPMELVLVGEGAEWFEDNVERNATIKVYCDLIYRVEKIVKNPTSGGFGPKDPQVFTNTVNEKIVYACDDPYPMFEEGEESQKAFDPKAISQALAVREELKETVKNGSSNTVVATAPKTGFGGTSTPTTPTATPTSFEVDTTDIPF